MKACLKVKLRSSNSDIGKSLGELHRIAELSPDVSLEELNADIDQLRDKNNPLFKVLQTPAGDLLLVRAGSYLHKKVQESRALRRIEALKETMEMESSTMDTLQKKLTGKDSLPPSRFKEVASTA